MPISTLQILLVLVIVALYLTLSIWCELNSPKEIVEEEDEK